MTYYRSREIVQAQKITSVEPVFGGLGYKIAGTVETFIVDSSDWRPLVGQYRVVHQDGRVSFEQAEWFESNHDLISESEAR